MRLLTTIAVFSLAVSFLGCSFQYHARDADTYRRDTRALLSTKNADIRACYDQQLKTNENASGDVVVDFKVQEDTGTILNAAVNQERTTAPAALSQCVVDALDGLALDPPDAREGVATFTWEFKPPAKG